MHLLYTPQTYNYLRCLIVRTLSAPIYLSNSTDVFGHRAILMWGIEAWLGIFHLELSDTLNVRAHDHSIGFF